MQHQRKQRRVGNRMMEAPILYWHPSFPDSWVAWSSEGHWMAFPAASEGWAQRAMYTLPVGQLRPAERASETIALSITGARRVSGGDQGPDPLQGEAYAAVNPEMPLVVAD
jgi:hypothetical protein